MSGSAATYRFRPRASPYAVTARPVRVPVRWTQRVAARECIAT